MFTNPIETLIVVTLGVERIENVDGTSVPTTF